MDSMGPLPFGASFCGDLVRVQGHGASQATTLCLSMCVCVQTAVFLPLACPITQSPTTVALSDHMGAVRPPVCGKVQL